MKDLKNVGLEVCFITTDPNTAAYKAAESFYQEGQSETEPQHLIDSRHLSENFRKKLKNDSQLVAMMPAVTKAEREKLYARFAIDLSMGCTVEVNQANTTFPGDSYNVISCLSYIVDAIVCCCMGFHYLCKQHSFVCDGGANHWINRSAVLPPDFVVCGKSDNDTEL